MLTNEQMFKLVWVEVLEGRSRITPRDLLFQIVNSPHFISECEDWTFCDDDGKLDEGEIFLLDWLKKNQGNWGLLQELMPIAERLEMQLSLL